MHSQTQNSKEKQLWIGLILFITGAIFILQRFEVIPESTWSYFWPIALLVTGLKMIMTPDTNTFSDQKKNRGGKKLKSNKSNKKTRKRIAKK